MEAKPTLGEEVALNYACSSPLLHYSIPFGQFVKVRHRSNPTLELPRGYEVVLITR